MVSVQQTIPPANLTVLAQANLSIGAECLLQFYLVLSLLTLTIAGGLAWLGYWPVLVFALIHQGLVGWALWWAWRSQWIKEWFMVSPNYLRIVRRDARGLHHWRPESGWVRITWSETKGITAPSLVLQAGDERQEVGTYLNTTERRELARLLCSGLNQPDLAARRSGTDCDHFSTPP